MKAQKNKKHSPLLDPYDQQERERIEKELVDKKSRTYSILEILEMQKKQSAFLLDKC